MPHSSRSRLAHHWLLDPRIHYLNHGSFGATPGAVLERQRQIQDELEHHPVRFLERDLEGHIDEVRSVVAPFLGAQPTDLAFVTNVTSGTNAVLKSLRFQPGDELLTTDHIYNASRNIMEQVAAQWGARVVLAEIPFPLEDENTAMNAILSRAGPRTRLALIDHVTSPTALVLPIEKLVPELESAGVACLVDGAHGPGMLPLHLDAVGASYYTGNFHKWVSAPKASGFLHVRRDRQDEIHPVNTSHGANSLRSDRSQFLLEFDWEGTEDPSALLSVPRALEFLGSLHPEGWDGVMGHNRRLARRGRDFLCRTFDIEPPCPDSMLGSMAAFPLRELPGGTPTGQELLPDPLQLALREDCSIEIPVFHQAANGRRLIRLSAHLYNHESEMVRLADALNELRTLAQPDL